jgi:isochorismate synthase EntC
MPADQPGDRAAVSLAERINSLVAGNLVFAAFRMPGERPRAFIRYSAALHSPQLHHRAWWMAPFEAGPDAIQAIVPDLDVMLDAELPPLPTGQPPPPSNSRPGLDRAGYASAVEQAVARIHGGTLDKVVLARTIRHAVEQHQWGGLFQLAAERLPDACIALVRTHASGTWLGASPERLLSLRDDRLEVDALAGTMPAGTAPEAAMWGAKEIAEQQWVTRMVEDTLRATGVQSLRVQGPSVKQAGPVAHLHSVVTGSVGGTDVRALALALHPTPAVGGMPRAQALVTIAGSEPRPRGPYAGFWGLHEPGRTELFVNIRSMELFRHHALLHVGAGITAGSDPERECVEVERKASTWTSLIDAVGSAG